MITRLHTIMITRLRLYEFDYTIALCLHANDYKIKIIPPLTAITITRLQWQFLNNIIYIIVLLKLLSGRCITSGLRQDVKLLKKLIYTYVRFFLISSPKNAA